MGKYLFFSIIFLFINSCSLKNKQDDIDLNSEKFSVKPDQPLESLLISQVINGDNKDLDLIIPHNKTYILDKNIEIGHLTINGSLICAPNFASRDLKLKVKSISINGSLICGTRLNPYLGNFHISLKDSELDPQSNPLYRGILVHHGGRLLLHGNKNKGNWTRLDSHLNPGEKLIKVSQNQVTFDSGDKIAVGSTSFNYEESEIFEIESLEESSIKLSKEAQYFHWGEIQNFNSPSKGNIIFDERAEVINLSRNIKITTDRTIGDISLANEFPSIGGHVMIHHHGFAQISGVEFEGLGQEGILGRYPIHWHLAGNSGGQYIKHSSIHHSNQRCIVIHQTNQLQVRSNSCYANKGHGIFLEDGNEIENKITHNIVMKTLAPAPEKSLLVSENINKSENQGRYPSVASFWISNPDNFIQNNISSGSVGTGFWMSFKKDMKDSDGQIIAEPLITNTDSFDNNIAHSSLVGITWDGRPGWENANNPLNPSDKLLLQAHYAPEKTPTFNNLTAYKNILTGIYFRGTTAKFSNAVFADNGWNFWVAYNQILEDSIVIGRTNNHQESDQKFFYNHPLNRYERFRKTGVVLYDGPFEVHKTDFLNFSTEKENFELDNGQIVNSTVVPFTATGGSNKYVNITSQLSFNPQPKYKMHIESIDEKIKTASFLNHSTIRDLDGSLNGTSSPSLIVAKNSLLIPFISTCTSKKGLYNFRSCPASFQEGSFVFRDNNPWVTPFLVLRNDGKTNYPFEHWNVLRYYPNNLFTFASHGLYSFKLLPLYEYNQFKKGRIQTNVEKINQHSPIVEIVSYGNNCSLENALKVNSYESLLLSQENSFYTEGEKFFVKLIGKEKLGPITDSISIGSAYSSGDYNIICDDEPIKKSVIGEIESVEYLADETIVSGWACNKRSSNSIDVALYAVSKSKPAKSHFLKQVPTDLPSDPSIVFKCGFYGNSPKRFRAVLPKSEFSQYSDHKISVLGQSISSEPNKEVEGSRRYQLFK